MYRAHDLERRRIAIGGEPLVHHLAADQAHVEIAGLQPLGVLGRAFGLLRLDLEDRIDRLQGIDQRHAVGVEATTFGGSAHPDRQRLAQRGSRCDRDGGKGGEQRPAPDHLPGLLRTMTRPVNWSRSRGLLEQAGLAVVAATRRAAACRLLGTRSERVPSRGLHQLLGQLRRSSPPCAGRRRTVGRDRSSRSARAIITLHDPTVSIALYCPRYSPACTVSCLRKGYLLADPRDLLRGGRHKVRATGAGARPSRTPASASPTPHKAEAATVDHHFRPFEQIVRHRSPRSRARDPDPVRPSRSAPARRGPKSRPFHTTGWPLRSAIVRNRLSARTTNMPGMA